MEGERKSVKQQPLSSAQATEDADVTGDWAFISSIPCLLGSQREGDLFENKRSDVTMWEGPDHPQDHCHPLLIAHGLKLGKICSQKKLRQVCVCK